MVKTVRLPGPANQFTGKELDNNTGLYYLGARYYNPEVGMWLVPDPAGQGWKEPKLMSVKHHLSPAPS